jgi:hypothetical protein
MTEQAVIDFGSRSIKVYTFDGETLKIVFTHNWEPILGLPSAKELGKVLEDIKRTILPIKNIEAIATEAARRSPELAALITNACHTEGINFQVISQAKEAELIQAAFLNSRKENVDIFNVGGGSIQIVRPNNEFVLIPFGISDLNLNFNLVGAPSERKFSECLAHIKNALPKDLNTFVYTGGEVTYLNAVGAKINEHGQCLASEFTRMSRRILSLPIDEMEMMSPFGKGWMTGAVASNCIVEASLAKSRSPFFYPSDQNIAHGLIRQIIK